MHINELIIKRTCSVTQSVKRSKNSEKKVFDSFFAFAFQKIKKV